MHCSIRTLRCSSAPSGRHWGYSDISPVDSGFFLGSPNDKGGGTALIGVLQVGEVCTSGETFISTELGVSGCSACSSVLPVSIQGTRSNI